MTVRSPRKGAFQTTTHIAVVVLLLILFVIVAYFFQVPVSDPDAQRSGALAELRANQEVWEASRPVAFRYVVARRCDCDDAYKAPYIATEQDGARTAEFAGNVSGRLGDDVLSPPEPAWIDDLFDIAATALQNDDMLELRFDVLEAYPRIVAIRHPEYPDRGEIRYEIRDFEILEHRGEAL